MSQQKVQIDGSFSPLEFTIINNSKQSFLISIIHQKYSVLFCDQVVIDLHSIINTINLSTMEKQQILLIKKSSSSNQDQQEVPQLFIQNSLQDIEYAEEPYRYVNLIVFMLASIVNSLPTQTFTAINTRIVTLYDTSKIVVAMNGLLFPITHPILAFVANGILDKYGLKVGCSVGATLMIIGTSLRLLIGQGMWITLVGTLIASAGNIFIIDSPSKLANSWFKPASVPLITTLCVLSSLLSNGMSVLFPSFLVDINSSKRDIEILILVQAVVIAVPMFLLIIFLKSKPKIAPSFAAAVTHEENYLVDLKKLFVNKNYLILMFTMAMSYGVLVALLSDIEYIMLPFRFDNPIKISTNGLFYAIVAGPFGCILFIGVLKKTLMYKRILTVCFVGSMAQLIILPFSLHTFTPIVIYINIAMLGFFIIPITPISMQFGCEIAFPIGQASSSGFLIAAGQLFGFVIGLLFLLLLDGVTVWKVYLVCGLFALFFLFGIIALYFVKEDLRMKKYEALSVRKSKERSSLPIPSN